MSTTQEYTIITKERNGEKDKFKVFCQTEASGKVRVKIFNRIIGERYAQVGEMVVPYFSDAVIETNEFETFIKELRDEYLNVRTMEVIDNLIQNNEVCRMLFID